MRFAQRLRERERLAGFWQVTANPIATERLAGLGYDYLCLDLQHGLIDYAGYLACAVAADAGGGVMVARVATNDLTHIGRALDAGAQGVIVPLVDSAEEAAAAVHACRYAPTGGRSFGPFRSSLRIGPDPREADEAIACIVMIETLGGLEAIEEICRTPGLDGVYVGPADLALALGAPRPGAEVEGFAEALDRITAAAKAAGMACGIQCHSGPEAAMRLASGFTFASVASDLTLLEEAARASLHACRAES